MPIFLRYVILAILSCIVPDLAKAQVEVSQKTIAFTKVIGAKARVAHILKIAALPDGSILASGFYNSEAGGSDAWIVKLDRQGGVIWEKRFENEGSCQVTVQPNGDIISGSGTRISGAGELKIRKLDQSGQILWEKSFGPQNKTSPGFEPYVKAIGAQQNGNIVVLGDISHDYWYSAFRLLRLDNDGGLVQDQTFGKTSNSDAAPKEVSGLALMPDDSFAIVGNTAADSNGWVMRFSPSGALQWEKVWGEETDFRNISATPNEDLLIYAHTRKSYKPVARDACDLANHGPGCPCDCGGDLWLLRLDASGNVLWDKTHPLKMSTDGSVYSVIAVLVDGTFVLSGVGSAEPYEPVMLRFDAAGNLIAEKRGTHITAIGPLPNCGFALAGWPQKTFGKSGTMSISAVPLNEFNVVERKEFK